MTWHVDEVTLDRYRRGSLDDAAALSAEAHVLVCAHCRDGLAGTVDDERLARMWEAVLDRVDGPRPGVLERVLGRLGVPQHVARLLAATPSLRLSWLGSVAAALAFAVMASRGAGGGLLPFLVLAPLLPVAGVAVAYGSAADPAFEIGLVSPVGGFRLMLIRASAVLAASLGLTGIAAAGLPELDWLATAWLVPALALTVVTLVLSSAVPAPSAAAAVALSWVAVVAVVERLATRSYAAFGLEAQLAFAAVAVAALAGLVARRHAFERTVPGG